MTHAELESLAGVIRVFGEGKEYGDPYEWVATVRWIDRETVEVLGAMQAPTVSQWRAIVQSLRDAGVKDAIVERKRDGREYTRRIKIAR